jgi:hypothetical protein
MGYHYPINAHASMICAYLGDSGARPLDCDVYAFTGQAGEKIAVSLSSESRQFGRHAAQAILILTNRAVGSSDDPVYSADRSALPNHITRVLPCDGPYLVIVKERPETLTGEAFTGPYRLTLTSSGEAAAAFRAWTRD